MVAVTLDEPGGSQDGTDAGGDALPVEIDSAVETGAWPIGKVTALKTKMPQSDNAVTPALRGGRKLTRRSMRWRNLLRDSKMPTRPRLVSGRRKANFATSRSVGA